MNPISPFHNPVFLHPSRTHEGKVALRHPRMIRKVLPSSKNLTCNEFLATNNSLLHEMPAGLQLPVPHQELASLYLYNARPQNPQGDNQLFSSPAIQLSWLWI